jgi:hypothetical protein
MITRASVMNVRGRGFSWTLAHELVESRAKLGG